MLLQISDMHARPGQDLVGLVDGIAAAVSPYGRPSHVIGCGDFGFQGRHTDLGARFMRQLADRLGVKPPQIVCCPGNHDIETVPNGEKSFQTYHREMTGLLQDAARAQPVAANIYEHDGTAFLVLNSAHLLDWAHGHIEMSAVKRLTMKGDATLRIAVVHHHCIPFDEADPSHIANAYPLLTYLEAHGFHALLHGHRHMAMTLRLHTLRIVGVGSVNYPPAANINNQFNLIEPGERLLRFRFIGDAQSAKGAQGDWVCQKDSW
jgi:3',5'-cyclic AMP phosphodiesterase CpdA